MSTPLNSAPSATTPHPTTYKDSVVTTFPAYDRVLDETTPTTYWEQDYHRQYFPSQSPGLANMDNIPSFSLSSLPPWPYLFAYCMPPFMLTIFLNTFSESRCHDMCDQVGFPQPRKQPLNAFIHLFGQRCLSICITLAILEAYGEWRAVVVLLACMCLQGLRDGFLVLNVGEGGLYKAVTAHWIVTMIGSYATWKLWQEHWGAGKS